MGQIPDRADIYDDKGRQKVVPMAEGEVVSPTNPLPVSSASKIKSEYIVQDVIESGNITYVGKETNSGAWLFVEIDTTTNTVIRYANISNNPTETTYTAALSNKDSLVYALLEDLTFS